MKGKVLKHITLYFHKLRIQWHKNNMQTPTSLSLSSTEEAAVWEQQKSSISRKQLKGFKALLTTRLQKVINSTMLERRLTMLLSTPTLLALTTDTNSCQKLSAAPWKHRVQVTVKTLCRSSSSLGLFQQTYISGSVARHCESFSGHSTNLGLFQDIQHHMVCLETFNISGPFSRYATLLSLMQGNQHLWACFKIFNISGLLRDIQYHWPYFQNVQSLCLLRDNHDLMICFKAFNNSCLSTGNMHGPVWTYPGLFQQ